MDYGIKKRVFTQIGLVTIVAVLVGGFELSSVYGQANTQRINFQSDFESTAVPLCGGELVKFGGTAHFVFNESVTPDGSIHSNTHMNYQKTSGIGVNINGVPNGERYQINEVDHFTLNENSNPVVVHSVITGTLIHNGKGTNTVVVINLLTVFDENGIPKTTIDKVELRCNGKGT